jgi:uncharacterized protein involved in outer membrane biogenesis
VKLRRILLVALLAVALLVAAIAGLAAWLLNDEAFLKKQLAQQLRKHTGRELTVSGPLELQLGRETTVRAAGVSFSNAPWATNPVMARAERLEFTLVVPSLWTGTPELSYLLLEDCHFEVLNNPAGESNWKLLPGTRKAPRERKKGRGLLPFLFEDASITACSLFIDGPERRQPLDIRIEGARLGHIAGDRIESDLSGRINDFPLSARGWLAPASVFSQGGELSHELDFRAGEVSLYSSGTVADIRTFSGVDLHGHFKGPDISNLLDAFTLPPLSEGPFDFRSGFSTQEGAILIDIDGDLGTLDVTADGVLDRLHKPGEGQVQANITGPDLEAFGEAFGLHNLVREPFVLDADFRFENGIARVELAQLDTARDRLALSGTIASGSDRAGSDLSVAFDSEEIGRWAPLMGKPVVELGAVRVEGDTSVDSSGKLSIDARATSEKSELAARGTIGPLEGPMAPDLDFEFRSDDMPRLATLAGFEGFPSSAFSIGGHARKEGRAIRLDDVVVSLDRATATVDGHLSLADRFSGSDIETKIDIPDLGEFGGLFALENWPGQRLELIGGLRLDGQAIRLVDMAVRMDNASATVDGSLVLSGDYSGTEINADIDIPNMGEFGPLVGLEGWPGERLQVSATAGLEQGGMVFRVSDGSLGEVGLKLNGKIEDLDRPLAIDTDFEISLPSLDAISRRMPNYEMPPGKFEASGQLIRRDERIDFGNVRFKAGEIEGGIDGYFTPEKHFDVQMQVAGPDVTKLDGLLEIGFEPLPFSGQARLAGNPAGFIVEGMKIHTGKSDLNGDLEVERGDHNRISGSLHSHFINLTPWTAQEEDPGEASVGSPSRYVFREEPVVDFSDFGLALDLRVHADQVVVAYAPYFNLDAHLLLHENRLELSSFSVEGVAGGVMQGELFFDGSRTVPSLDAQLSVDGMKIEYGMLEGQDPETLPTANLRLDLKGSGRTRREMASSLDGKIRLDMGPGLLMPSTYGVLVTSFSSQLFNAINPNFDEAQNTFVECSVAAADITAGRVSLQPLIINSHTATIFSQGHIDLGTEEIDLSFNSKARTGIGLSASDFVNPFVKVGGTLVEPTMEMDKKGALVQGGLAVATAGLSIIGRSLGDRYLGSKDPCGDALKEIRNRDTSGR